MANLVRREPEQGMAMPRSLPRDPFQLMRQMMNWDPFGTLDVFSQGMPSTWTPQFDVKETPDGYVLKADLPGIEEKDVDINVTGNRLVVSGSREDEGRHEGESYYTYERSYGTFMRSFTLPDGIDSDRVEAELKNGVLTLMIPKRDEVKPRRVPIKKGIVEKVKQKLGVGDDGKEGASS